MKISEWLHEQRVNQSPKIDMLDLAKRAGLSQSAISRIESGDTIPTLESVIRINQVLNGNISELYFSLTKRQLLSVNELKNYHNRYPGVRDIEWIDDIARKEFNKLCILCSNLLNELNENLPIDTANRLNFDNKFTPEQIKFLFVSSPLFDISMRYPNFIDEREIKEAIIQNGIIIHQDFTTYIRSRIRKSENAKASSHLEPLFQKIYYGTPINEDLGKLKFDTLLELDEALAEQGEIFLMGWKIVEFEYRRSLIENDEKTGFV